MLIVVICMSILLFLCVSYSGVHHQNICGCLCVVWCSVLGGVIFYSADARNGWDVLDLYMV